MKQRLYLILRSGVLKFAKISNIHFDFFGAKFFKVDIKSQEFSIKLLNIMNISMLKSLYKIYEGDK